MRKWVGVAALLMVMSICVPFSAIAYETDVVKTGQAVQEKATRIGEGMVVPKNETEDRGRAEAQKSYEYFNSPEFQQKLKQEENRVKSGGVVPGYFAAPDTGKRLAHEYPGTFKKGVAMAADERVYLLASSSMPVETVRNYVRSLAPFGQSAAIVMVGMKGGLKNLKEHMEYMNEILKIDPACTAGCMTYPVPVYVDPRPFARYEVTAVPAIVYVRGVGIGELPGENSEWWGVMGDESVAGALREINEYAKSDGVKKYLDGGMEGTWAK